MPCNRMHPTPKWITPRLVTDRLPLPGHLKFWSRQPWPEKSTLDKPKRKSFWVWQMAPHMPFWTQEQVDVSSVKKFWTHWKPSCQHQSPLLPLLKGSPVPPSLVGSTGRLPQCLTLGFCRTKFCWSLCQVAKSGISPVMSSISFPPKALATRVKFQGALFSSGFRKNSRSSSLSEAGLNCSGQHLIRRLPLTNQIELLSLRFP